MKNIWIMLALLSLVLFSGCTKTEEVEAVEETPVADEEVAEENLSNANPAEIQGTMVTGDYNFDNFAIVLTGDWLELSTVTEEAFGAWSLSSDKGIMMQLSVMEAPDLMVDENSIREEVEEDSYLKLEQETTVDLDNGVKFYGGFIDDHATSVQFCYYKTKVDTKVVSVIFSKKESYSEDDLKWVHDVLSTFEPVE